MPVKDETGKRYGRWTVVERSGSKFRDAAWLCKCDCGNTNRVSGNDLRSGISKSCGCYLKLRVREKHPGWKGGRVYRQGYVRILVGRQHPAADLHGQVPEHRFVMEKHLGRYLFPHETVHHKNGVKDDNRIENLELWSSNHPKGQRIPDKIAWAEELLRLYAPEKLVDKS